MCGSDGCDCFVEMSVSNYARAVDGRQVQARMMLCRPLVVGGDGLVRVMKSWEELLWMAVYRLELFGSIVDC